MQDEADQVHQKLRHRFIELIGKTEYVIRPWIWGAGDSSSDGAEDLQQVSPAEAPSEVTVPEPVGVVCRVFDVVSPQSDPDLEGVSSTESGDVSQPLPVVPSSEHQPLRLVPICKRQMPLQGQDPGPGHLAIQTVPDVHVVILPCLLLMQTVPQGNTGYSL